MFSWPLTTYYLLVRITCILSVSFPSESAAFEIVYIVSIIFELIFAPFSRAL